MKLIGPFFQLLSLDHLPLRGKLSDEQLEVTNNAGIVVENDLIKEIGEYNQLIQKYPDIERVIINKPQIALPAYVDAHTHICFGGNRANDFAMRNAGKTYLEIAEAGGGIWSSVQHTRQANEQELTEGILKRVNLLISQGITTIEIKSGYGLNIEEELKMLRAIKNAQEKTDALLIPTCLSAHLKPRDFEGSSEEYLNYILEEILHRVKAENLASRVDIFIEKSAFAPEESKNFLQKAKEQGFQITVHADQFTPGSSRIAVELGAKSADHLEATIDEDIDYLASSNTVAIALPGASLGLGESFAPARKILDKGGILAIATDWNPGSAPMGDLITQAAILATFQKLTTAEVLAAITYRAAYALDLNNIGVLKAGNKANFITYQTDNFQNILYHQGTLKPHQIFINGKIWNHV